MHQTFSFDTHTEKNENFPFRLLLFTFINLRGRLYTVNKFAVLLFLIYYKVYPTVQPPATEKMTYCDREGWRRWNDFARTIWIFHTYSTRIYLYDCFAQNEIVFLKKKCIFISEVTSEKKRENTHTHTQTLTD